MLGHAPSIPVEGGRERRQGSWAQGLYCGGGCMTPFYYSWVAHDVLHYASVVALISFAVYALFVFLRPSWRKPAFYIYASSACYILFFGAGILSPLFTKSEMTSSPETVYAASRSIVLVLVLMVAQAALRVFRPKN